MILRECPCVEQVQCHLASLLDLSHQHATHREVSQDIVPALHAPFNITVVLCDSHCKGRFTHDQPRPWEAALVEEQAPENWTRTCAIHSLWAASRGSSGIQGIALAVGLASTNHLEEVWALLEHLGRTKFLRSAAASEDNQVGRSCVLEHVEQGSNGQRGCQPTHAH